MYTLQQTETFAQWLAALRDVHAKARIAMRLDRVRAGNLGDAKPVGEGVSELRVDVGPGYRLYFTQRSGRVILLLAGGDKSTQARDIQRAQAIARELET
ncbi:MAG: type II toxin-antitoxin system RelE/ParE family toxin [Candidatus Competibacteraceae bacterium]|nr:type II toxin-antitoxin system RelE/ParE family toxin [Candidatus Competibacteraceae bacterium]